MGFQVGNPTATLETMRNALAARLDAAAWACAVCSLRLKAEVLHKVMTVPWICSQGGISWGLAFRDFYIFS